MIFPLALLLTSFVRRSIAEHPEQPNNLKVLDKSGRSVKLLWTPPHDGNSPITRYIIEYKHRKGNWDQDIDSLLVPGDQNIALVLDLAPATIYQFRIVARNEIGNSDPSDAVTIITEEEAPSGPPLDVKVEAVDEHSLRVTWKAPMKDEWNGNILGYYVGYKLANSYKSFLYETVENIEPVNNFTNHLIISELQVYTEYVVVVSAFNRIGQGPKTEVRAYTAEGTPLEPPQDFTCTTLSSQIINVSWSPPSLETVQGVIKGYKVMYMPYDVWYDEVEQNTKITDSTEIHLNGLQKATNYTLEVLTYTAAGEGVPSNPIHCQTDEDIPDSPASVKALVTSANSIIVSWLTPEQPNGIITQYTVYYKKQRKQDSEAEQHKLPPTSLHFHATGLKQGANYVFWVTASTAVGEGERSQSVHQKPSDEVPAKISSFDNEYLATYREDVKLECQEVGIPNPDVRWTVNGQAFDPSSNDRMRQIIGALLIREVRLDDAGEYTCHVENPYGADTITHTLLIQAPPHQPKIQELSTTTNSIEVKLEVLHDDTTPLIGYTIYYRQGYEYEWEDIQVPASPQTNIPHLQCGSQYHMYATAYNKIGYSESSEILSTHTKGRKPEGPELHHFVEVSYTSITLKLDAWGDGGCPIQYFVVEYKARNQVHWTMPSSQVRPSGNYAILDLLPATWYNLRITAYNNVGSSIAEYDVATHPLIGAPKHPPEIQILSTTTNSIEVKLKPAVINDDTAAAIIGYTIYYKSEFSDWESIQVPVYSQTYILHLDIRCGSQYQIYASASNKIGDSESTEILNTRSKGSKPEVPELHSSVEVLYTSVTLNLDAWGDGGCPIEYFAVAYKSSDQVDWTLVNDKVKPNGYFVIMELTPATQYRVAVKAHNSAGYSVAGYDITTLTVTEGLSLAYPQDAAEDVSVTEATEAHYETIAEYETAPEYESGPVYEAPIDYESVSDYESAPVSDYESAPGPDHEESTAEPLIDYDDIESDVEGEEYVEPDVDYSALPEFISEGKVIPVEVGGTAELPCTVNKEAQHVPIIKKLARDGDDREPLYFVGDIKVQRDRRLSIENGVMKLTNVKPKDAGDYSCYFESEPIVEIRHTIDIQYPPSMVQHSEDQRVLKGGFVTLNCTVTGNPMPNLVWSRVDGRLPNGLHEEEMLSMTLEDVDRHVEGTYTCKADNGIGSPVTADIHVAVEYEPEIITEKAIITHADGKKLEIVCIVYSRPIAQVTWELNGEATIEFDPNIQEMDGGHRHAIAVPLDNVDYYGEYTCIAENVHGNASESVYFAVEPTAPEITSEPEGDDETSYTLVWHSESYTPITEYNITYITEVAQDLDSNETGIIELGVFSPIESNTQGIKHSMHHKLVDLTAGTEYEVVVQVSNQFTYGEPTSFTFTTKAATTTTPATTTSSTTTTVATTTLKLEPIAPTVASKNTQHQPKKPTSGSSIPSISVFLLLVTNVILRA